MVRVIIKVQELFQLQETIPRHDISNCRKSQHRAPIIKILCTFCYAQQHVHANKSLYLFPVSVHISPCFLYIVYKLVFSTTKLIKESGKKDKKYYIGVQSVSGGLLKVPLRVILAGDSILFFHQKTRFCFDDAAFSSWLVCFEAVLA